MLHGKPHYVEAHTWRERMFAAWLAEARELCAGRDDVDFGEQYWRSCFERFLRPGEAVEEYET